MSLIDSFRSSASSELSEDFSSLASIPDGTTMEYSDDQIRLLYQIVTRAEAILSELSPSSRLPTLALFRAYDEILPEHGMDPDDDQHISKLVFLIGGVRSTNSLTEKFKILMARMGITLHITRDDSDEISIVNDADDHRFITTKDSYKDVAVAVNGGHADPSIHDGVVTSDGYTSRTDRDGGHSVSIEENLADLSKIEQHLENSAIAFQQKHHSKFSSVTTLRQWQKRSSFISNLCDQFEAARQADLEEDMETKFQTWRALAAEIEGTPLHAIPNIYSKRIEEITVRAHEIHTAKIVLRHWRQCAREQRRKARKIEESSDPLERIAAKAHKNLMLSRALVNWSNRLEEESEKAQIAAKAYELSLKSKAFGIRNRPGVSTRTGGLRETPLDALAAPDLATLDCAPNVAPISERMGRSVAINRPGLSDVGEDVCERIPPEGSGCNNLPPNDVTCNSVDEMDETTLLARRHILRMRYYEAWEKHTADNICKVKDFETDQQDKRIAHAVSVWRSQIELAFRECEGLRYNALRVNYHNKATKALDAWRRESEGKAQDQDQILQHYAARAYFYYQTTKVLPVWRTESEHATQQQGVLALYANRAEYYYKATKSLPFWRRTQQIAAHEEQTLASYAQRADYYYTTRGTLLAWHDLAKQKRKQRLKEAHLGTRRIVKKGMGQRCIAQWRSRLQPSLEWHGMMDAILEDVVTDREWRQSVEALDTWRERAQEQSQMALMSDATVKGKVLERWREHSTYHEDVRIEAEEHWKEEALPRVLKNWNLSSLQIPNRPLMVANALEKKERKLLRTGFEGWYGRTADRLVPIELADGSYKSMKQVVEDARQHGSLSQARGLFNDWKAAAQSKTENVQQEAYTPTPGRPRIFLGTLGRRETTTPLAPVPSRTNWRASDTALRGSLAGARTSRTGRPGRNLRVSWAQ
ncbi:hypothetical protein F4818DRAFT_432362 [Hypoxylon cercidicola]|nr:hypothetical protein F4818DRAFT_432362 [Hypoxylon cercidicola]